MSCSGSLSEKMSSFLFHSRVDISSLLNEYHVLLVAVLPQEVRQVTALVCFNSSLSGHFNLSLSPFTFYAIGSIGTHTCLWVLIEFGLMDNLV